MHLVRRAHEYQFVSPRAFEAFSAGYTRASLVDDTCGSMHTGLTLNEIAPGGSIGAHVHSYEEGVYILSGQVDATIGGESVSMTAGDYSVIKVGTLHAWKNSGAGAVRWLEMNAPQPKPFGSSDRDTFVAAAGRAEALGRGQKMPRSHFDATQIPPESERPAGLAKGVFLKWLVDEHFGAAHHRLVFIEYQPGASIAPHDHTFEEAYFILSGEVEATADGKTQIVGPGDVVWTGVGCVHAFKNVGREPVRWLETFAPQPPAENVFRFSPEWAKRAAEIEGA